MSTTADPPPAAPDDQDVRSGPSEPDEAALADLCRQWGAAYEVAHPDEQWTAWFRNEAEVLTASTPAELGALICQDYSHRQASMGQGERALRQLRDDGII